MMIFNIVFIAFVVTFVNVYGCDSAQQQTFKTCFEAHVKNLALKKNAYHFGIWNIARLSSDKIEKGCKSFLALQTCVEKGNATDCYSTDFGSMLGIPTADVGPSQNMFKLWKDYLCINMTTDLAYSVNCLYSSEDIWAAHVSCLAGIPGAQRNDDFYDCVLKAVFHSCSQDAVDVFCGVAKFQKNDYAISACSLALYKAKVS